MIIIRCKVTDNPLDGYIHKISQVVQIVVFLWSCRGGGWESKKAIGEGDGRERMGIKVKSPTPYKKERIGSRLSLSLFQSVMVTDSLKIFISCRCRMSCLRLNFLPLVDILFISYGCLRTARMLCKFVRFSRDGPEFCKYL